MATLSIIRRQIRQLRDRLEHDEDVANQRSAELARLQYEAAIIDRMLANNEGDDRDFWETERLITNNQCELFRAELYLLQEKIARNRELLCMVERDLQTHYH